MGPGRKAQSTERTEYGKYRNIGGIQSPFVSEQFRNGGKVFRLFSNDVQVNQSIPPGTFELPRSEDT